MSRSNHGTWRKVLARGLYMSTPDKHACSAEACRIIGQIYPRRRRDLRLIAHDVLMMPYQMFLNENGVSYLCNRASMPPCWRRAAVVCGGAEGTTAYIRVDGWSVSVFATDVYDVFHGLRFTNSGKTLVRNQSNCARDGISLSENYNMLPVVMSMRISPAHQKCPSFAYY